MSEIKIRFNTQYLESENQALTWRILKDGKEELASHIQILVNSSTTKDIIEGGIEKWHITCHGNLTWNGSRATINREGP